MRLKEIVTRWIRRPKRDPSTSRPGPEHQAGCTARRVQLSCETLEARLSPAISPLQALHDPGSAAGDLFGSSLASSGAYVLVGAPGVKGSAGAAYLEDTSTHLLRTFSDPNGVGGDLFGSSVALSGTNVLVGAPGANQSAGAAYLYNMSGKLLERLDDPGGTAGDDFGVSLAISGTNILVGADGANGSAGAVYLCNTSGRLLQTISNPSGTAFGHALAASGTNVLIGASGAAYLYSTSGRLLQSFADPNGGDTAVAISGTKLLMDAGDGFAYLYKTSGKLLQTFQGPSLDDFNRRTEYRLGDSVALSGRNVLISGGFDRTGFLFQTSGFLAQQYVGRGPSGSADSGSAVAFAGNEVFVGADSVSNAAGAVFVYNLPVRGIPVTVSSLAGSVQGAEIGTVFHTPLEVRVTDVYGDPVANVPVTFSAPGSGPSGIFMAAPTVFGIFRAPPTVFTNALGIATAPALTANEVPGRFTVTAEVAGLSTIDFSLTNTALPLREFVIPTPGEAMAITRGPDGNMWFTEFPGEIGRITRAGKITMFPLPTSTLTSLPGITAGSDGNLWFTEGDANKIGRITPSGQITEFTVPTPDSQPAAITLGPDGNIWFTELDGKASTSFGQEVTGIALGRITPSGVITEFPPGTPAPAGVILGTYGYGITAGPDGNIWLTDWFRSQISRVLPDGATAATFTLPLNNDPTGITTGPDGNLWFTEFEVGKVGRITPSGAITQFALPSELSTPFIIAAGPGNTIWFTEDYPGMIGEFILGPSPPSPTIRKDGGDRASAVVGTAFSTPLKARVIGADGAPLRDYSVTFTVQTGSGGAGATFSGNTVVTVTTNRQGVAVAPALTANAIAGSFAVTASVSGIDSHATFVLTNAVSPSVTMDPVDEAVAVGQKATFTVAADGIPAPRVQWQVSRDGGGDFRNIKGATLTTLTFRAAFRQDGDEYRALFTNPAGQAYTTAATLTVVKPKHIFEAPNGAFFPFAYSVALSGNNVLIGSASSNSGAGAAYLYNTSGRLLQEEILHPS